MTKKHNLNDLRELMFKVLDDVQNNRMPAPKAQTMINGAKTIIEISKTEIQFMKLAGAKKSEFVPLDEALFISLPEKTDTDES